MMRTLLVFLLCTVGACQTFETDSNTATPITLTLVGTNDVHGQIEGDDWRGGLTGLSAFVAAMRAARARDGGHLLLIDAGDMWQGTLESNISEGAAVVAAFNALGYDAVAVGNHEFDFGPVGPAVIPTSDSDDARGALKQRALEANFPLLAANLAHQSSGQRVDWPNMPASILIQAGPLQVGIIGVMTSDAMSTTIAANVDDLRVLPLEPVVTAEARALRERGADVVVVTAHAGGRCEVFLDPYDLSSCRAGSEIFELAQTLPKGLVDHIFAGHVHQGIAHMVNDISITSAFSNTRAFSRVDLYLDPSSGDILDRRIYAPQAIAGITEYESTPLATMASVSKIGREARVAAETLKQASTGITLATPFTLESNPESTLGNLFLQALQSRSGADIVLHNVSGGLRANLPQGELRFGSVYEMFPFDNRAVYLQLSGQQLREVFAEQAYRARRRVGVVGLEIHVACEDDRMHVDLRTPDGAKVFDEQIFNVLVNDYLAFGGDKILRPILPDGGIAIDNTQPLTRDLFLEWAKATGGSVNAADFSSQENPRWNGDFPIDRSCVFSPN